MLKSWFYKGLRVLSKLREPYYQGVAAEVAFYLLFSMVPIFTLLAELLSLFDISLQVAEELIQQVVKGSLADSLISAIEASPSGGVTIIFAVMALWSASKAQFSMIRISNYSYRFDGKPTGGYIRSRVQAIITIAVLIALIACSLIILVYGEVILKGIEYIVESIIGYDFHFDMAWLVLRWPLALVIFFVCLLMNYTFLTGRRISIKKNIPGTIFASLGLLVTTGVYAIYTNYFSNFNAVYGGFATIIALLLWFYILCYVMVIGVLVNVVWQEG